MKAATFSTFKWPHLARQAPVHVIRCSIGRSGEVAVLQRDDQELAALAAAELAELVERIDGDQHSRRLVAKFRLEAVNFVRGHLSRHRGELSFSR